MGEANDEIIAYYRRRAEGGAGAVTIGTVRVGTNIDSYRLMARQLCIDHNYLIPGFYRLTEALHREGSKAIIQLQPGMGSNANPRGILLGDQFIPGKPAELLSPSGIGFPGCPEPRALSTGEIEEIVAATVRGAYRAKFAGFDALEINAHALYLVAQFMSPEYNRRTDKYGQDRLRFLLEMVRGIKENNGKEYPVIIRYTQATWPYPLDETFEDREDVKEAQAIAKRLEEAGVDAIQISYNYVPWIFPLPSSHWPEDFAIPLSRALKKAVKIPIILTERMRDPELADSVLRSGKADFVAMARALIADPDLPKKYASGHVSDIWSCIACNECLRGSYRHLPIRCTINPTAGRESEGYDYRILKPVESPKEVMVIGAGPAGMETARVAALRGHKVTLIEKESELGNKVDLISRLPGRKTFGDILNYYSLAFKTLGGRVEIARGSEVTPGLIAQMEKEDMIPDVFVIATGCSPAIPEVPGVNGGNVITFIDAVANKGRIGEKVVIVGASIVGCEVALFLANQGKKVTLVELPGFSPTDDIDGFDAERNIWALIDGEIRAHANISLATAEKLDKITAKGAVFTDQSGKSLNLDADTVVLSLGFTPTANKLAEYLKSKGKEVYTVGAATEPKKIKDATYEGFTVASRI